MHEVHTSTGCPKQCVGVLAAMPTMKKIGKADLCSYRFVKENRQCRLLTNMGGTMDCPGQVGKFMKEYADENRDRRKHLVV